jgi:membrane dipeptidase
MVPIIDFHCDLLGSIEGNQGRLHFSSPETNCSLPQLKEGGVHRQTLALFTADPCKGAQAAEAQVDWYRRLLEQHKEEPSFFLAIENASCLVTEKEPLDKAFERLQAFSDVERILYVSLTWNFENRFGGGTHEKAGLKADGKELLQFLNEKKIAIDLSHASDPLAYDILEYIDQKKLSLTPIASHSNFRSVHPAKRNLPDDLAMEIMRRGGVIGLNFVKKFVGSSQEAFVDHIHHALELGGGDALCLGADFYGALQAPGIENDKESPFFSAFSNASCYQHFLSFLKEELWSDLVEKIAYKNAESYLLRKGLITTVYQRKESFSSV